MGIKKRLLFEQPLVAKSVLALRKSGRLIIMVQRGETLAQGEERGLGAVSEMQFIQNITDMLAHGTFADRQFSANLLVRIAPGHKRKDFNFSRCKTINQHLVINW